MSLQEVPSSVFAPFGIVGSRDLELGLSIAPLTIFSPPPLLWLVSCLPNVLLPVPLPFHFPRICAAATAMNTALIEELATYDRVLICGQALSHCVKSTTEDLVAAWKPGELSKLVLLKDASSPVPGFEEQGSKFVADMEAAGVTVCTIAEAMP